MQFGENSPQALLSHWGNKLGLVGVGERRGYARVQGGSHREFSESTGGFHIFCHYSFCPRNWSAQKCVREELTRQRCHIPDTPDTGETLEPEQAVGKCQWEPQQYGLFIYSYSTCFLSSYSKPSLG